MYLYACQRRREKGREREGGKETEEICAFRRNSGSILANKDRNGDREASWVLQSSSSELKRVYKKKEDMVKRRQIQVSRCRQMLSLADW